MFEHLKIRVYRWFHINLLKLKHWYRFYRYNNAVGREKFKDNDERLLSLLDLLEPSLYRLEYYKQKLLIETSLSVNDRCLPELTRTIWECLRTIDNGEVVEFKQDRSRRNEYVDFRLYLMLDGEYIVSMTETIADFKEASISLMNTIIELRERKSHRDNRNLIFLSLLVEEIDYLAKRMVYFQFS